MNTVYTVSVFISNRSPRSFVVVVDCVVVRRALILGLTLLPGLILPTILIWYHDENKPGLKIQEIL